MSKMETHPSPIKHFKISCRYNNVLSIFDAYELSNLLRRLGYDIVKPLPPPRYGVRVGFSGIIAQKQGRVLVDGNSDKGVIGVFSRDPLLAIREFIDIEEAIKKDIRIDLKPYFYEVLVEAEVYTDENPLKVLSNIGEKTSIIKDLSKVVKNISLFGLRLSRKNQNPDSVEWLDIQVLPSVVRADKAYFISIVYRSKDRENVANFGEKILEYITGLINCIESHGSE